MEMWLRLENITSPATPAGGSRLINHRLRQKHWLSFSSRNIQMCPHPDPRGRDIMSVQSAISIQHCLLYGEVSRRQFVSLRCFYVFLARPIAPLTGFAQNLSTSGRHEDILCHYTLAVRRSYILLPPHHIYGTSCHTEPNIKNTQVFTEQFKDKESPAHAIFPGHCNPLPALRSRTRHCDESRHSVRLSSRVEYCNATSVCVVKCVPRCIEHAPASERHVTTTLRYLLHSPRAATPLLIILIELITPSTILAVPFPPTPSLRSLRHHSSCSTQLTYPPPTPLTTSSDTLTALC
ncbi:hypothetical protein J6590_042069 [Homalodisca vitripennis]|nr:hypothetical protein J6590_042069 [Homalodisca vitripennis]